MQSVGADRQDFRPEGSTAGGGHGRGSAHPALQQTSVGISRFNSDTTVSMAARTPPEKLLAVHDGEAAVRQAHGGTGTNCSMAGSDHRQKRRPA